VHIDCPPLLIPAEHDRDRAGETGGGTVGRCRWRRILPTTEGPERTDSFVEVWERKFAPFGDRTWMKAGPCEKCPEWRLCQGNSFHLWDLDAGRPRICHFRDFGLGPQPADRRLPEDGLDSRRTATIPPTLRNI